MGVGCKEEKDALGVFRGLYLEWREVKNLFFSYVHELEWIDIIYLKIESKHIKDCRVDVQEGWILSNKEKMQMVFYPWTL